MSDSLEWWEKWPIGAVFTAQGLYVAEWYVGERMPAELAGALSWLAVLGGVAAWFAIDGAMIATVMGMRAGRRSRWSVAAIIVTAAFGAAVALDLYGAFSTGSAWLHAGFALTIVCYLMHAAAPKAGQVNAPANSGEDEAGPWERRRRDRADRFRTPQIVPQGVAATAAHDSAAPGNITADRGDPFSDEQFVDWLLDQADQAEALATQPKPARDYTCKHCGQAGLTSAELMAHGRRQKRHGSCQGVQVSAAD